MAGTGIFRNLEELGHNEVYELAHFFIEYERMPKERLMELVRPALDGCKTGFLAKWCSCSEDYIRYIKKPYYMTEAQEDKRPSFEVWLRLRILALTF